MSNYVDSYFVKKWLMERAEVETGAVTLSNDTEIPPRLKIITTEAELDNFLSGNNYIEIPNREEQDNE